VKGYGSFCPIAKAAEVLAERWNLLILRDILIGSRHFNEFRRSLPLMSPTLLAGRLRSLEEAGVIVRSPSSNGHGWEYRPTPACEELRPLIEMIGHWGQRWVRSELTRDELDPASLMWFVHRHMAVANLPARRVVIYVEFTDLKRLKQWWLVVEGGEVDLCVDDPGYEVDVTIYSDLLSMTQIYIGDLSVSRAISSGRIKVHGSRALTQGMPRWFARSRFADDNPRPIG
jgi:DNA-binding HxlR family transcriptional regulator/putative sterol carrier protein